MGLTKLQPFKKQGSFPNLRLRRTRKHDWVRRLVAEHTLSVNDLIQPLFLRFANAPAEIASMPGIYRYTLDELPRYVDSLSSQRITAVALFPHYEKHHRTDNVEELIHEESLICQAVRLLKQEVPDIGVITDVSLDSYTSHGQDGIVRGNEILNDETLEVIRHFATLQAEAGADIIAPSEMMDGRVQVIRQALDDAGHSDVAIMAYAAKFASNFYGPFRDALGSKECLGQADKKTYQLDPANGSEALREAQLDVQEGADMLMVKPGLPYLDVLYRVKHTFGMPTFSYHVSGEFAMLKAAAQEGMLDFEACLLETLISFKRAGADGILTYGALDAAKVLNAL